MLSCVTLPTYLLKAYLIINTFKWIIIYFFLSLFPYLFKFTLIYIIPHYKHIKSEEFIVRHLLWFTLFLSSLSIFFCLHLFIYSNQHYKHINTETNEYDTPVITCLISFHNNHTIHSIAQVRQVMKQRLTPLPVALVTLHFTILCKTFHVRIHAMFILLMTRSYIQVTKYLYSHYFFGSL